MREWKDSKGQIDFAREVDSENKMKCFEVINPSKEVVINHEKKIKIRNKLFIVEFKFQKFETLTL